MRADKDGPRKRAARGPSDLIAAATRAEVMPSLPAAALGDEQLDRTPLELPEPDAGP
jgi:hypothetical protein